MLKSDKGDNRDMINPIQSLRSKSKNSSKLKIKGRFSRSNAIAFGVVFAGIGTYIIVRSFAATPPNMANVFIAPNGSDTGSNCRLFSTGVTNPDSGGSSLCKSFAKAYQLAQAGDVIEVQGGTYTDSAVSDLSNIAPKATNELIVFQPAAGATVNIGYVSADNSDNIEVRDMHTKGWGVTGGSKHIVYRNLTANNLRDGGYFSGADDVQIIGGEIGYIDPGDGIHFNNGFGVNTNITIDGLYMHDLTRNLDPAAHTDCIQTGDIDGLVIKNSTFQNCATQGLFLNPYNGGKSQNITIENNFLGIPQLGYNMVYVDGSTNVTLRNNSLVGNLFIASVAVNVKVKGNILAGFSDSYSCLVASGEADEFSYNIVNVTGCTGGTNTTTDTNVRSQFVQPTSSASSAAGFDLHLNPGATAIGKAKPGDFTSTDIDGQSRDGSPDAGADEYQSAAPTAPPTNATVPVISGSKFVGQVLTTSNGTWNNSPSAYSYQWQRCNSSGASCANISAATQSTYTLVNADNGSTIKIVVTATNTLGSASATSAATSVITPPDVPPTVSVTSPTSGATVTGATAITANAADSDGTIAGVQFKVDGSNVGSEDTVAPYSTSWDTTTASNGTHAITAVARDSAGNSTTSTSVIVTVTGGSSLLIGSLTSAGTSDQITSQQIEAWPFTASGTGTASQVGVFIVSAVATNVKVGIYNDSAGIPGTLKASGTITNPTANGFNVATLTAASGQTLGITSGVKYWIGVLGTNGAVTVKNVNNGGCNARVNSGTNNLTALPTTFSASVQTFPQCPLSAYVTAASGGSTAKIGDLNGDNLVNISDLGIFLSHYGTSDACCNLDNTGTINIVDLGIFLAHYGT